MPISDHIILVLDDLSHLMSSAESTGSVLSLLDDLIRHSAKYRKRKVCGNMLRFHRVPRSVSFQRFILLLLPRFHSVPFIT